MGSVYMLRHQAGGVLSQFVFERPPTGEQMLSAAFYFEQLHGSTHPKTKEPYWLRVVEVPVLQADDQLPLTAGTADGAKDNVTELAPVSMSGTGTVTT